MIRSLVILTDGYPCRTRPVWLIFVRHIAHAMARQGVKVSVICPLSVHRAWRGRDPVVEREDAGDGAFVTVHRPRFVSFSSRGIGRWNTLFLTLAAVERKTRGVLRRHFATPPDAFYGHFLYAGGALAVKLGCETGAGSFPAVGEGSLTTLDIVGRPRAARELAGADGIIVNSSHLVGLVHEQTGYPADRIGVFSNGINRSVFRPLDRAECRRRYGFPPDLFLVASVGTFFFQKGVARAAEAIRGLPGVGGVFVGSGPVPPVAENTVFNRRVGHEELPALLSACDAFVLPTMDEGCCNAILEAMGCGLPVISSTGAFNDDILNPDVSIRTDPLDVPAIRAAIVRLRDDPAMRSRMAAAALAWSARFDADLRARRILDFMAARIAARPAGGARP